MSGIKGKVIVKQGDCVELLRRRKESSIDAIVTDPPYGLEFMGKDWDSFGGGKRAKPGIGERGTDWVSNRGWNGMRCRSCGHLSHGGSPCSCDRPDFAAADDRWQRFQEFNFGWAVEALRVLKPGGHLLAFGGTRTFHRMAVAIEDAGFEIRDSIAWMYGSGFPKSHNLKDEWQGWGTALKPAFEPIIVARKPLIGTVAANVTAHGTGALNIDASRIGHASPDDLATSQAKNPGTDATVTSGVYGGGRPQQSVNVAGRWPANVILDESQAAALDEQSGQFAGVASGMRQVEGAVTFTVGEAINAKKFTRGVKDFGGASRFFMTVSKDGTVDECAPVSTAAPSSSPPRHPGDSAPSGAATSEHPDTSRNSLAPSTSDTAIESKLNADQGTQTIPSSDERLSPESKQPKPTQSASRARDAEQSAPTDTTTTTTSRSLSDGSVEPATSNTTPDSRGLGVSVLPIETMDERFKYCAKASKKERPVVDGVAHSTVKPLALMRYLVRLVTPPDGIVLDPFAGSGTTLEAALLEGFRSIGYELTPEHIPLIDARLAKYIETD